jgi:hypothetical protein
MTTDREEKQQWEYLVGVDEGSFSIKINGVKYKSSGEYLNAMGLDGWELCGYSNHGGLCFIFKRPITTTP